MCVFVCADRAKAAAYKEPFSMGLRVLAFVDPDVKTAKYCPVVLEDGADCDSRTKEVQLPFAIPDLSSAQRHQFNVLTGVQRAVSLQPLRQRPACRPRHHVGVQRLVSSTRAKPGSLVSGMHV